MSMQIYDDTNKSRKNYDTGWIDLSISDGKSVGSVHGYAQFRRIGKTVYLRGDVKTATNASGFTTMAILPAGCRPSKKLVIPTMYGGNDGKVVRLWVNTIGEVALEVNRSDQTNIDWYCLDGMCFLID